MPSNSTCLQFHLLLYTDVSSACSPSICSTVFCDTDPGNAAGASLSGCDCSAGSILLTLDTQGLFAGQFAYPLIGLGTTVVQPTGVSDLCIAGNAIGRYAADAQAIGTTGLAVVDLLNANSAPQGGVPTIGGSLCNGNTWRFQWWHRDGMAPSRFSKGVAGQLR